MIVACPHCTTRYTVDPAKLGMAGRQMQCAKCEQQWFQPAAPGKRKFAGAVPIAPDAGEAATAQPPLHAERKALNYLKMALWLTVGTVVGITTMLLISKETVVAPGFTAQTMRRDGVGTRLDLSTGMVLSDIQKTVRYEGDLDVLLFTGKVTNTNPVRVAIPEIRVQLLDVRDVELDFWPAETAITELEPGDTTTWTVRFIDPPLAKIAKYRAFIATPGGAS